MILQTKKAFFSNLLMHIGSLRVKKRLLKVGCIVSLFGINASIVYGTDLRIRAQDDETEGGLKLNLTIPQFLEDGPKGAGIEVIAEGNERELFAKVGDGR